MPYWCEVANVAAGAGAMSQPFRGMASVLVHCRCCLIGCRWLQNNALSYWHWCSHTAGVGATSLRRMGRNAGAIQRDTHASDDTGPMPSDIRPVT